MLNNDKIIVAKQTLLTYGFRFPVNLPYTNLG